MDELQKLVLKHLDRYFPYLHSFGFDNLKEEENYFICPWYFLNNGMVQLSIQCQGEASLLHLCIDRYDFRLLEPDNTKLADIESQFDFYYSIAYESNKQSKKRSKAENALLQLEKLENEWLEEMSAVLLRHPNIFSGNLDLLNENYEYKYRKEQEAKDRERIEKGLFSLAFYQFPEGETDPFFDEECPFNCELEFADLDEVNSFLKDNPDVKIYRILDCYLNEIKLA